MTSIAVDTSILIRAGGHELRAVLERELAPQTCAAFDALLPFHRSLIHCRWCGEATWIPLGDFDFGVDFENATTHPAPGEVLVYPGNLSETEILMPYGAARFASKAGELAGNHFMTIVDGREALRAIGEQVLWNGAIDITFERVEG